MFEKLSDQLVCNKLAPYLRKFITQKQQSFLSGTSAQTNLSVYLSLFISIQL